MTIPESTKQVILAAVNGLKHLLPPGSELLLVISVPVSDDEVSIDVVGDIDPLETPLLLEDAAEAVMCSFPEVFGQEPSDGGC